MVSGQLFQKGNYHRVRGGNSDAFLDFWPKLKEKKCSILLQPGPTFRQAWCADIVINRCDKKTSWNLIPWAVFQYNFVLKLTRHNSKVTTPGYWGLGITFFALVKKEKFTSDELEQDSYSALTHKLPSRLSYAALAPHSIAEIRVKKWQKIGTFDFAAHRHKNWTMINPNCLFFFFFSFFRS